MTLLDLWSLLKKNWWLVIALPVVCAVVCWGVMGMQPASYSAMATLVTSGQLAAVNGQATGLASQKSAETGLTIEADYDSASSTVTVTATGADSDAVVAAANEVALATQKKTYEFLGQELDAAQTAEQAEEAVFDSPATNATEAALLALLSDEMVSISVTEATAAKAESSGAAKYTIVALIAGLLLAICIVVIRDMVRGSIHNAYEVEENYELRLLGRAGNGRRRSGELAGAQAESLLAALDFAGDDARALCLVPMESTASAAAVVATLEGASASAKRMLTVLRDTGDLPLTEPESLADVLAARMEVEADLALVVAPAVADSADYAYLAPACGCAVLVLEAMRSKRVHVEDALRQLALSKTEVAGFIMVDDR